VSAQNPERLWAYRWDQSKGKSGGKAEGLAADEDRETAKRFAQLAVVATTAPEEYVLASVAARETAEAVAAVYVGIVRKALPDMISAMAEAAASAARAEDNLRDCAVDAEHALRPSLRKEAENNLGRIRDLSTQASKRAGALRRQAEDVSAWLGEPIAKEAPRE